MGKTVQLHLRPVRVRQQWRRAMWIAAWGLLAGSLAGLAVEGLRLLAWPDLPVGLGIVVAAIGMALGLGVGRLWRHRWLEAATAVDDRYGLKDRATTALALASRPDESPVHQLALGDALAHLSAVKAEEVVPLRMPRVLPYALGAFAAVVVVAVMAALEKPAVAETPAPLPVVVAQAERAAEELKELEAFAAQEKNPELDRLLAELQATLAEMKEPGTDLREALAKLSEMQSVLEAAQAEQNAASSEAQLKAVGEALALAEPLAEAGAALASGEYEKAAEALEQLAAPALDRPTEKAVKEKLEAARRGMPNASSPLSQAIGKMAEGLGSDSNQFSEGSKKLAGEARKEGRRKKLMDLLQKQCNCLSECKGECEGECQAQAQAKSNSVGKGGKKWGLGASDGALGERTPQLSARNQEKITGKQSDEGEIETETEHAPEGSQQAQREYRQQYARYKEISESVLENEPIPLGHRQTIRKYFESIRPSDAETDAVNEAIEK